MLQIKARSYAIWGGMEKLDEEKQRRSEQREKKKEKRYAKQVRGKCILVACSMCGLVTNHVLHKWETCK